MKTLSMICAMLVLVLNLVPCADAQERVDQQNPISVYNQISAQSSETEHAHPIGDSCTPFCHCSCCAASSIVKLFFLNAAPISEYQTTETPYFSKNYIDITLPIWQPPQWS